MLCKVTPVILHGVVSLASFPSRAQRLNSHFFPFSGLGSTDNVRQKAAGLRADRKMALAAGGGMRFDSQLREGGKMDHLVIRNQVS